MFGATPFITALLARLSSANHCMAATILAMAAAVVGLALSVVGSLQAGALAGMAVAFIVVLCMSGNYVVVRHRRDVGMAPAIWLAGVISGLAALPFAEPANVTWSQVPWLLALSPGQLAVGLLLYMASLRRIPAGRAALLGLLELVLGPVWVWLFDGEKPDNLTLLGGIIVIGAAAANVWLDSRRATG
jgi:drug/metabolite transporter (DMT)-like permease